MSLLKDGETSAESYKHRFDWFLCFIKLQFDIVQITKTRRMLLAEDPSGHSAAEDNVLSLPDKSLQSAHVPSGEAIPETLLPDPQNKSAAGFSCNIQPNIPWPLIGDSTAPRKALLMEMVPEITKKYNPHEKDITCVHMVICPDAPK